MQRDTRRRIGIALVSAALAATGGIALGTAPAAAEPVTWTFDDVGEHSVAVPEGVCEITVDAYGAEGAGNGAASPGLGGRAQARLSVTPGQILRVAVGGAGEQGAGGEGGAGGFNGGGAGGDGYFGGGGGGGASDVRRSPWTLSDRLVVAGGGGGNGSDFFWLGTSGGGGGGVAGETGYAGYGVGGEGGTQSHGGAGGERFGTAGSLGVGGNGPGDGDPPSGAAGGGGGGGLHGGGSGGLGRPDYIRGGGGGGGSGFTPDGTGMETGVRQGDGLVTITYDPDAVTCPSYQPDAQVRVAPYGAFVGDDVYDPIGGGQRVSAFVLRLFTATYDVRVENDGDTTDTFTVTGSGGTPGFTVAYVVGATDVTAEVAAGTYATPALEPGQTHTLRVRVTVQLLAPLAGRHVATVTAVSAADPTATDAVRAITTTI